jgi:4-amino-4-deoxy-L-arabinose transferase-like glycosyltransferase
MGTLILARALRRWGLATQAQPIRDDEPRLSIEARKSIQPEPARRSAVGAALLAVALALALCAQSIMLGAAPGSGLTPGAIALYGLAAAAVVAGVFLSPLPRAGQVAVGPAPRPLGHRVVRWGGAAAGLLLGSLAAALLLGGSDRVLASTIWLTSWLLLIIAATPWHLPPGQSVARALRRHATEILILLAILAVAAAFRLPYLDSLPGNIHNDEASVGLQARQDVSPAAPPLLSLGWSQLPQWGYVYAGLFLKAFGNNLWALRLSSVVAGLLSIVVLYLLSRELFNRRVAALAAAFMAVAHVHVHWSRMGIHCIHAVLVVELALWLAVRAMRTNRVIYYVLAGLALTVSFQVYFGARIAFLLLPVLAVATFLANRALFGRCWHGLVLGLAAALVALAPLLAMIEVDDPSALAGRASGVSLFNTANPAIVHHYVANAADYNPWAIVWRQVQLVPLIFSTVYDSSVQHPVPAPITDRWTAMLFFLGFVYCLVRLRRPGYLLGVVWFVAVIALGGVTTTDFPSGSRIIAMLPTLALLPALFADAFYTVVAQALDPARVRLPALALCTVLLALAGRANYQIYNVNFATYPQEPSTTLARYLARLPHEPVYAASDTPDLNHQAVQFVDPNLIAYSFASMAELRTLWAQHGHGVVLLTPDHWSDVRAIEQALDTPRMEQVANNVGQVQYMVIKA